MKKTGIALGVLAVAAVVLEFYALSDPNDDIITITSFMRSLPCWSTSLIWGFVGVLIGHFYWK